MDKFDKSLLNMLQDSLPVCSRPYAVVAERLGVSETQVLNRIRALKEEGYIRRIGTFFDSEHLGYAGTLIALSVAEGQMEKVALFVNKYAGVTHNYERDGEFNLWFTLLTQNKTEERQILAEIRALPGVQKMMNLPSSQKYKINVTFRLT